MSAGLENRGVAKADIRDWWAGRPMTYGERHGDCTYRTETGELVTLEFGSREFFDHVDKTFYSWTQGFHTTDGPFAGLFPYQRYRHKRVLEIGCGMGTMAMNWARQGAIVTAVDLNPVAIAQTRRRFDVFGLSGTIQEMDANTMALESRTIDYVYSWGVLHHSPDLSRSIAELFRVLRPGGEYALMLYNRASVYYKYYIEYLEGFLHGEAGFLSPLQLASRYTDGSEQEGNPYTWPVTPDEVRRMFRPYSLDVRIEGMGLVEFAFPPKIGTLIPRWLIDSWSRRWGWSLWITGTKGTDV